MDIYRYFNSKDVAEHLRSVGYEPSAFEAAYVVEHCDGATIEKKIFAWRQIIGTMPDCPTAWTHDIECRESTHAFLREYIDLQRRMLDLLEHEEGFVYIVKEMRYVKWPEWMVQNQKGLWIEDVPYPFSSLEKCIGHLRAELEDDGDEFDRYVIERFKPDCTEAPYDHCRNRLVLDGEFQPLEVSVDSLDEHDKELGWILSDAFVEMSVPFKNGDVVIDRTDRRPHPFVFTHLKFWDSTEFVEHGGDALSPDEAEKLDYRVARADERHGWDDSHMVVCGYELGEDYDGGPLDDPCDICCDVFGACYNYLNLEYYKGPLEGKYKLLDVVSRFLKKEIDIECAMNFARMNALEHQTAKLKRSYDSEYVEDVRDLY